MGNQTNSSSVDLIALDREALARMVAKLQGERDKLLAAITEHHSQRADDRCWMDDDKLYEAAGLPPVDRRVGDKFAMLANCERFLQQRCESGGWPTYAELEAQLAAARAEVERLTAVHDPQWDATDAACACWWRGHDHTTEVFCALVNDILDGKDDGSGANREPWASTRKRLLGQRAEKSKWQRRAKLFHEAYKKKDFESFALDLQKMQLEASGADVILPWQNRSLRAKLFEACKERNRLRAVLAQVTARVRIMQECATKVTRGKLPCRVDEMTPREFEIFQVTASYVGALEFVGEATATIAAIVAASAETTNENEV